MKERNISLDAMKGFVILLVMIGHILILNEINDPYIYPMIEAVQMPVFIMISGYISGFKAPLNSFKQWKGIMTKRSVTYLVPFFSWLVLKQWDDLARGFTNTLFQLDRGLWFLMTLFLLNVLLYTTQLLNTKFYKKSKLIGFVGFCVIFAMLSSVFFIQYIMGNTFLSPILTIKYLPPFILGYLLSVYKEEIGAKFTKKIQFILFVTAGLIFVILSVWYNIITDPLSMLALSIIKGLLGCYVIFYIFLKSKENVIKSKLSGIGKYTLEIYTIHFHFATKLNPGILNFELYSLRGLIFVLMSFIVMSVTSAAFIYMSKQTWITNLLLFGRKRDERLFGSSKINS